MSDCAVMVIFAQATSGITSVGLNAVALRSPGRSSRRNGSPLGRDESGVDVLRKCKSIRGRLMRLCGGAALSSSQ